MPWFYLFSAGLLEVGWPIGLKMAQEESTRWIGIIFAILCIAGSGTFLWLAQKTIPMGTAYAVWTGIGAAGAFIAGILLYNDIVSAGRVIGATLIIAGVITLKLST